MNMVNTRRRKGRQTKDAVMRDMKDAAQWRWRMKGIREDEDWTAIISTMNINNL